MRTSLANLKPRTQLNSNDRCELPSAVFDTQPVIKNRNISREAEKFRVLVIHSGSRRYANFRRQFRVLNFGCLRSRGIFEVPTNEGNRFQETRRRARRRCPSSDASRKMYNVVVCDVTDGALSDKWCLLISISI